jgi:hypothetical protein
MKKLIVFFMLVALTAIAQPVDEQPEPEFSNNLYSYEAQIAFGSKTNLVWENVDVVSTTIMPDTYTGEHFYGIAVLGGNRRTYWVGLTPNGESVKIGIHMPALPDGNWWGFYRARFRPFPLNDSVAGEGWSETSYYQVVIDLSALPIAEAFVGTPE